MRIEKPYVKVRNQMQIGDIIAFGGADFFSSTIRLFTSSSVSHVGIVNRIDFGDDFYKIEIIESGFHKTSKIPFIGVKTEFLSDRINDYESSGGQVWWLPLGDDERKILNKNKLAFLKFLYQQNNKPYDLSDAIKAGIDILDKSGITKAKEDFNKFFCSELAAASFEKIGILPSLNSSEVTPIDLCMFGIYQKNYYQLVGKSLDIKAYNSIPKNALKNWGC